MEFINDDYREWREDGMYRQHERRRMVLRGVIGVLTLIGVIVTILLFGQLGS